MHPFAQFEKPRYGVQRTRGKINSGVRKKVSRHYVIRSNLKRSSSFTGKCYVTVSSQGLAAHSLFGSGKIPQGYPHRDPNTVIAQSRQTGDERLGKRTPLYRNVKPGSWCPTTRSSTHRVLQLKVFMPRETLEATRHGAFGTNYRRSVR